MSKLPTVSGEECTSALGHAGFRVRRQEISYVILRRNELFAQVTVPDHDVLDRSTLGIVLRSAGLSLEEFIGLLS